MTKGGSCDEEEMEGEVEEEDDDMEIEEEHGGRRALICGPTDAQCL